MKEISAHLQASFDWYVFEHSLYLQGEESFFYSKDFNPGDIFHYFSFTATSSPGIRILVELDFVPPYFPSFRRGWEHPIIQERDLFDQILEDFAKTL